jgi:hypothetical protein
MISQCAHSTCLNVNNTKSITEDFYAAREKKVHLTLFNISEYKNVKSSCREKKKERREMVMSMIGKRRKTVSCGGEK